MICPYLCGLCQPFGSSMDLLTTYTADDLRRDYPLLDPWVYEIEDDRVWIPVGKMQDGHRPTFRFRSPTEDFLTCIKEDDGYGGCLLDKIASDLAGILQIPVPPSLLRKSASGVGLVSLMPGDYCPNVSRFITRHESSYGESPIAYLASIYPDSLIPFDLWVWNMDRHDGNLIHVERYDDESTAIYGIDHGHSFGCQGRPGTLWDQRPNGLNPAEIMSVQLPTPASYRVGHGLSDKASMITICNSIADLPSEVVKYVVGRAALFSGRTRDIETAGFIAEALTLRRTKVKDWIEANH